MKKGNDIGNGSLKGIRGVEEVKGEMF